ncbi:GerMN domain-containing protein [Paenibacillus sp. FJAT-26967]|uniref:GerMN domain-containing protein n=1 Tax=Paenibacillus sp. FJAT-26967 TaxID=1729690 RepID=UPI000837DFCB|nr:GerMN domain-containing protein [Paenibacillus sp. FJAT-26967]
MKKKLWMQGLVIGSLVLVAATGCGQKEQPLNPGASSATTEPVQTVSPTPVPTTSVKPSPSPSPSPEVNEKSVKAYYSDPDLTKIVEKTVKISYKNEGDKYKSTLEALKKSVDEQAVSLFEDVQFQNVKFDKEELKIDLKLGQNAQFGAGGEMFFVEALEKTLFQFPEVKAIYLTKDGSQVESLMGHVDLPYPIKRK